MKPERELPMALRLVRWAAVMVCITAAVALSSYFLSIAARFWPF